MDSISLEKTQSPVSGFCHSRNRVCNADMMRNFQTSLYRHIYLYSNASSANVITSWFELDVVKGLRSA